MREDAIRFYKDAVGVHKRAVRLREDAGEFHKKTVVLREDTVGFREMGENLREVGGWLYEMVETGIFCGENVFAITHN